MTMGFEKLRIYSDFPDLTSQIYFPGSQLLCSSLQILVTVNDLALCVFHSISGKHKELTMAGKIYYKCILHQGMFVRDMNMSSYSCKGDTPPPPTAMETKSIVNANHYFQSDASKSWQQNSWCSQKSIFFFLTRGCFGGVGEKRNYPLYLAE